VNYLWGGGGSSSFAGSMTAYVPPLLVSQESSGTVNISDFNTELTQEKTSFAI